MRRDSRFTRRQVVGAGAAAGLTLRPGHGFAQGASPLASPAATPVMSGPPLWEAAWQNGIVYGTSLATWQADDEEYLPIVDREAAVLFTEDDLLWWRLKPSPDAELDFSHADRFFEIAEEQQQLVIGAHLVWDEGFGEGWVMDDLWGLDETAARTLLFDTLEAQVDRYKGRVAGWITVNEVIDAHTEDGLRTDYPWLQTIGPSVVADAFVAANEIDPDATLILNEFGFETDSEWDLAADRRRNALLVLDSLLDAGAPVHAFGVQAHLDAANFSERFDADAYREFLGEIASRGLGIVISEMDVLDDNVPADPVERDEVIADAYARYLEVALDEPAVFAVVTFGLTDRYTWLQEDYPRDDGADRRPLPFDMDLRPKPAYDAIREALAQAPEREPVWEPPRAG